MQLDPLTNKLDLTPELHLTDKQRYGRGVDNPAAGDRVKTRRLDGSIDNSNVFSTYAEYVGTVNPETPSGGRIRLFSKTSGTDTDLFVMNDAGVVKELVSSTSISLDGAYNNGSVIAVDNTSVVWKLSAAKNLRITDATDATTYFQVSPTQIDILETTLVSNTNKLEFRDTALYISSKNDGFLDLDADTAFRFNTGNVGIGGSPSARLHITDTVSTGTVNPTLIVTDAAHTALTASTERHTVRLNTSVTQQWATGNFSTQRIVRIDTNTLTAVGASTITDAMTVAITGAPIKSTNVTLTNTHALYIAAGAVSTATNSYGLTVNAQTGATNNYAAQFLGGLVTLGKGLANTKSTATIATGAVTYGSGYMEIDTEAAAAADDLDTITAGIAIDGTEVILKSTANARVITVTHAIGNIHLNGGLSRVLDNVNDRLTLMYDGTNWVEKAFSSNT